VTVTGTTTRCPVCDRFWAPWVRSKLTRHARCYYTEAEGDALYERWAADPRLSVNRFAAELGVPPVVLTSAFHYARKRRQRRGLKVTA
jgi:transcription initiation factor TFIIIB Brf1 subunit/transcription initiation factor TFIIB